MLDWQRIPRKLSPNSTFAASKGYFCANFWMPIVTMGRRLVLHRRGECRHFHKMHSSSHLTAVSSVSRSTGRFQHACRVVRQRYRSRHAIKRIEGIGHIPGAAVATHAADKQILTIKGSGTRRCQPTTTFLAFFCRSRHHCNSSFHASTPQCDAVQKTCRRQ